jgi:hypothetical protein
MTHHDPLFAEITPRELAANAAVTAAKAAITRIMGLTAGTAAIERLLRAEAEARMAGCAALVQHHARDRLALSLARRLDDFEPEDAA